MTTAHEAYGEPNDKLGKHKVCNKCYYCITCGDCKCTKELSKCINCKEQEAEFLGMCLKCAREIANAIMIKDKESLKELSEE